MEAVLVENTSERLWKLPNDLDTAYTEEAKPPDAPDAACAEEAPKRKSIRDRIKALVHRLS